MKKSGWDYSTQELQIHFHSTKKIHRKEMQKRSNPSVSSAAINQPQLKGELQ